MINLKAISLSILLLSGCNSDTASEQFGVNGKNSQANSSTDQQNKLATAIAALPLEDLMQEEQDAILFMREEEKLARDAYQLFYQLWGQNIFDNISAAEQMHMDAMLLMIERYELTDPISDDDTRGVFENSELQNLYDILATMGSYSLIDALKAGAEIEEVDLIDLEIRYQQSDNQDIHIVFDELMKGSRNHLRSFVSNLEKQGIDYQPLHLSQEAFDAIINSAMENGQ